MRLREYSRHDPCSTLEWNDVESYDAEIPCGIIETAGRIKTFIDKTCNDFTKREQKLTHITGASELEQSFIHGKAKCFLYIKYVLDSIKGSIKYVDALPVASSPDVSYHEYKWDMEALQARIPPAYSTIRRWGCDLPMDSFFLEPWQPYVIMSEYSIDDEGYCSVRDGGCGAIANTPSSHSGTDGIGDRIDSQHLDLPDDATQALFSKPRAFDSKNNPVKKVIRGELAHHTIPEAYGSFLDSVWADMHDGRVGAGRTSRTHGHNTQQRCLQQKRKLGAGGDLDDEIDDWNIGSSSGGASASGLEHGSSGSSANSANSGKNANIDFFLGLSAYLREKYGNKGAIFFIKSQFYLLYIDRKLHNQLADFKTDSVRVHKELFNDTTSPPFEAEEGDYRTSERMIVKRRHLTTLAYCLSRGRPEVPGAPLGDDELSPESRERIIQNFIISLTALKKRRTSKRLNLYRKWRRLWRNSSEAKYCALQSIIAQLYVVYSVTARETAEQTAEESTGGSVLLDVEDIEHKTCAAATAMWNIHKAVRSQNNPIIKSLMPFLRNKTENDESSSGADPSLTDAEVIQRFATQIAVAAAAAAPSSAPPSIFL